MNYAINGICGVMFGGKTTELIRHLDRARRANRNVLAVKPDTDTRYDARKLCTHTNLTEDALVVPATEKGLDMLYQHAHVQAIDVIGIDEAQFFPHSLIRTVLSLQANKKMVVWAGLDMDYQGRPFGPVPGLMAISTSITKLTAVCMRCGADATHTYRKSGTGNLIEVGVQEYEARCYTCWAKIT